MSSRLEAGIFMSISSVSAFIGAVGSVGSSLSAGQNQPSSTLDRDLDQIREKGLSAWAHDQQMEKLKEKLRAQVLSDKKLSEDDLAAMPTEQRSSVETEIQKMIEDMIREAMKTAMEEAATKGKTQAVLLNISV
ncbi:MAG: hypothetical protein ACK4MH_07780 [Brevundimonas sp.]|uniref:hypothetical protein n=1 Tax=Brevundimonas sp. TaxID=1871086 RepID=UPI00391B108C